MKIKSGNDLTIEETLMIYDEVMQLEMIYLEGYSLSETIFSLVYMYDEKIL